MEIKINEKQHMRFLSLSWDKNFNGPEDIDHRIIDSLKPNKEIQRLHIHGYSGVRLPVWIENSLFICLVSLDLECCMKWKTIPSFQKLSSLKYLKLEHLLQLECIGRVTEEQFGSNEPENVLPPVLSTLIIRWCPSLKVLPAIPCTLQQLIVKHVGLSVMPMIHQSYTGTSESSSSPSSVKSCLSLLHIECCEHLISLDEGLLEQQKYLQSLQILVVRHCENLAHLPAKGLTELYHLSFLEIVACPMLKNVKTDGSLWPTSLKKLDINPCGPIDVSALMSMHNLTSLRRFTLFSCSNIEKLPSEEVFSTLKNLNDVSIARCKNLLSLGGLGDAPSLRVLSILCCDKLHHSYSPKAGCSFKLHKLIVDRQAMLLVEPIKSLRYTMELHIGDDYAMEFLSEEWLLQNASSLRLIEIGVAKNLQTLPTQMEKLESLQSLHIERAPAMKFLPQLPASLNKLTIGGCDPGFLNLYEMDIGSDLDKIKSIANVDMRAYPEGLLEVNLGQRRTGIKLRGSWDLARSIMSGDKVGHKRTRWTDVVAGDRRKFDVQVKKDANQTSLSRPRDGWSGPGWSWPISAQSTRGSSKKKNLHYRRTEIRLEKGRKTDFIYQCGRISIKLEATAAAARPSP
uniref:R13L1/DRL21-like LRR repeat region domain-containing protein n=1 Tax=Leersia perrieri TaxID=77586 RepID=A0A0D9XZS6_9ORYZ